MRTCLDASPAPNAHLLVYLNSIAGTVQTKLDGANFNTRMTILALRIIDTDYGRILPDHRVSFSMFYIVYFGNIFYNISTPEINANSVSGKAVEPS